MTNSRGHIGASFQMRKSSEFCRDCIKLSMKEPNVSRVGRYLDVGEHMRLEISLGCGDQKRPSEAFVADDRGIYDVATNPSHNVLVPCQR